MGILFYVYRCSSSLRPIFRLSSCLVNGGSAIVCSHVAWPSLAFPRSWRRSTACFGCVASLCASMAPSCCHCVILHNVLSRASEQDILSCVWNERRGCGATGRCTVRKRSCHVEADTWTHTSRLVVRPRAPARAYAVLLRGKLSRLLTFQSFQA